MALDLWSVGLLAENNPIIVRPLSCVLLHFDFLASVIAVAMVVAIVVNWCGRCLLLQPPHLLPFPISAYILVLVRSAGYMPDLCPSSAPLLANQVAEQQFCRPRV